MATAKRESDYIGETREMARRLYDLAFEFQAKQKEWNASDFGNTLDDGEVGSANEGITRSQVGAVVFDVGTALNGILDANGGGLWGNLAALK